MQRLSALLIGFASAALTAVAHAAPHLDYRAAAGCPTDSEFVAAVRARGGEVDLTGSSTDGIDVAIERTGQEYRGTVRVKDTGQSSEAREVRSAACSEVADGLAIVTALASQTGSLPESAPEASPSPAAPAPSIEATTPPPSPPAKPPASTRLHTVGQFHDETLPVSSGELRVRNDSAFTLAGGALFGIAPGTALPRFDLTLARTNFITTPDGSGHIVGGILRARWTVFAPAAEYRKDDWSAQFFGIKAGIGGCSQLAYDLTGLVLLVCGELGAGVAEVTTKDPTGHTTKQETLGLGTASVDLDVRYNLGRAFHFGLTAGGELWLAQIKATQSGGKEIFHTNPFGAFAVAGFGLHFW